MVLIQLLDAAQVVATVARRGRAYQMLLLAFILLDRYSLLKPRT